MSLLAETPLQGRLWPAVWKLLRLRLIITWSNFRRANKRRKFGMIVLLMVILGFLGFIFFASRGLLRLILSPEIAQYTGDLTHLLEIVPALIFTGSFLGILLTSFGVLLQALYLAGDMDFLLSTPIPIRAVFISKLLQAILPNFGLICLFALPMLYGLGASLDYQWLYYPLVLTLLAVLALAAAGIASLLVLSIVRIFPARRVAEVLGFVGAIFSLLCSQSGQLAQWSEFDPDQADQAMQMMSSLSTKMSWSPLTWGSRGLASIGQGDLLEGAALLLPTLSLALVVFGVTLITAERLYYSGWASMQGNWRKKKAPRQSPRAAARKPVLLASLESAVPVWLRALMIKDWYVLRRDLRNMSQLVTPLILGIIYAVMLLRGNNQPSPADVSDMPEVAVEIFRNIALYGSVGISLFVGWALLGRLAGVGFSQEGRSYWLLKTAPISAVQLLTAKFMVAYLPAMVLGWGFLLITSMLQGTNPAMLLFTLPVVALSNAGNTGLNLAIGVTGANFNWEDPRRMQSGGSGCFAGLAAMLYLPINLALFFGPDILLPLFGVPHIIGQIAGLLLGGALSLVCMFLPLWLVRKRIDRLNEE